jgi:hypothetical protein
LKNVKSTDPRKPAIVAALREKAAQESGGLTAGRVTCVFETPTTFEGSVFVRTPQQTGYGLSRHAAVDKSAVTVEGGAR